jgi:uncharacterized protein YjbI with pentapeptide repeats
MAKMIKFNLTLSGATVSTFDELQDNFSAEILPIYRTGRLLKWLQARELTEQVQAVQAITLSDDDRELLGALCRALALDDDTEVINFLLKDWQVNQKQKAAALADTAGQTIETEDEAGCVDEDAPAAEPVDWSGKDMSARNFEGADLRNGIFVGTNFEGCNFTGADLRGANFTKANLENVVLSNSDCTGADFTEAKLGIAAIKANFTKSKFINTEFLSFGHKFFTLNKEAIFECNFRQAKILADIRYAMIACDFTQADLQNSILRSWLTSSNFHEANLSFVKFRGNSFANHWTENELEKDTELLKEILRIFGVKKLSIDMMNSVNFEKSQMLGVIGIDKITTDTMTENYKSLQAVLKNNTNYDNSKSD